MAKSRPMPSTGPGKATPSVADEDLAGELAAEEQGQGIDHGATRDCLGS